MAYGIVTGITSSVVAFAVWEGLIGGVIQLIMIGGLCAVWFGAGMLHGLKGE